jgi:hypothetical protein
VCLPPLLRVDPDYLTNLMRGTGVAVGVVASCLAAPEATGRVGVGPKLDRRERPERVRRWTERARLGSSGKWLRLVRRRIVTASLRSTRTGPIDEAGLLKVDNDESSDSVAQLD